jgi:hypothetical protein
MDVPLQIIDRYKHLQENKLVFGKMRSTLIAWLVQKLLVNVQEAENGYDSLWHRESHILPLRKSFCFFFLTKNQEITSFNYSIGNGLETS